MKTEQKTQNKANKVAKVEVSENGQLRLLGLRHYDTICVPEYAPFIYPKYPWRLMCNDIDTGGYESLNELTYYVLAAEKPDEIVLFINGVKYVARRASD